MYSSDFLNAYFLCLQNITDLIPGFYEDVDIAFDMSSDSSSASTSSNSSTAGDRPEKDFKGRKLDFSSASSCASSIKHEGQDQDDEVGTLTSLMNRLNANGVEPVKSPRPEHLDVDEDKENSLPLPDNCSTRNMLSHQHLDLNHPLTNSNEELSLHQELKHLTSTPAGGKVKHNIQLRTHRKADFPEGSFFGYGKHKHGDEISK